MAWDPSLGIFQTPWFPDPKRNGARVYEPAFSFSWDIIPDPPDTDVAKASKWQPTYPQPLRQVIYDTRGTRFSTWFYDYSHSDPSYQLDWYPNFAQPTRPIVYARGTDSVGSPRFQGIDLPPIKFAQTVVQPNRPVVRAAGTDLTSVLWFPSVETYQPGWQQTCPQPQRSILRDQGTSEVDPIYGFTTTTEDRWHPTYPHPNRTTVLPIVGSAFVVGLAPNTQDVVSHFNWAPTFVQPSRAIGYDRLGTTFATWLYDPAHADPKSFLDWLPTYKDPQRPIVYAQGSQARPTYFLHAIYAGDWLPTYKDPQRPTVYAKGSFAGVLPMLQDSQFAWKQANNIQPARAIVYARGTQLANPIWPVLNTIIQADRWMPNYIQPNRAPKRIPLTTFVWNRWYNTSVPDPLRGIASTPTPDSSNATSYPGEILTS